VASPSGLRDLDLRSVRVRPTRGAQEHRRWDRLVASHHYLSFEGLFGKALRHGATLGESWIALVGWQAAALKLAARDRWIGWSPQQQRERLHLITQNSRFVILPAWQGAANLASRVLGLSLRRLSDDMLAVHGFPLLLAESCVDPERFAGTCYRAANWRSLGFSGGYARLPGATPSWRQHGRPQEIFVYALQPDAARQLAQPEDDPAWAGPARSAPPDAPTLRSLFEFLGELPEHRPARGKRYGLRTLLAVAVAARVCGYRGVTAFAQLAALLSQSQRLAVECFYSPSQGCYTSPSITTFHNILATLEPQTLEHAVRGWALQQSAQVQSQQDATNSHRAASGSPAGLPGVRMDGQDVRGASKQSAHGRRMLLAAVEQGSGVVLGQLEIDSKTNEIPALRELARELDLAGRVVTGDALHAQQETARCLLQECAADYLVTAVKDTQPTLLQDLQDMDFSACPLVETLAKQHGRIERRRYWVKDISAPEWDDYAALYGRQQAIRVERQRQQVKTGKTSCEVSYALTSLGPAQASAEQLAALLRNHWEIENRLHYVRDFTYDEDRCRAHIRHLPRNLSCLTNAAIAIVRCDGRFRFLPEANRHYAARAQEALDAILIAPAA
jgi:predicted transposase YbfD/YdcC